MTAPRKDTLLLFDLDGTLWDSASAVAEAWNEVFQQEDSSLPLLTVDDIHSVMGMTMKEISETLYPDYHSSRRAAIFDRCCTYEVEYLHSHCGTLYPDFRTVLESLKAQGYELAVVSNCQRGYVEAFLSSSNSWSATAIPKASTSATQKKTGKPPSRPASLSSTPPTDSAKSPMPPVSSIPSPIFRMCWNGYRRSRAIGMPEKPYFRKGPGGSESPLVLLYTI